MTQSSSTSSDKSTMDVDQAQVFHDQVHGDDEEGWINGGCWCCCSVCDFDFDQVMKNTKARAPRE